MDIVGFFGKKLEEKTGIKEIACKGMIRLAFKDAGINSNTFKIEEYKKVFSDNLKSRFEKAGIENPAALADFMVSELVKNQGIFTMSA